MPLELTEQAVQSAGSRVGAPGVRPHTHSLKGCGWGSGKTLKCWGLGVTCTDLIIEDALGFVSLFTSPGKNYNSCHSGTALRLYGTSSLGHGEGPVQEGRGSLGRPCIRQG